MPHDSADLVLRGAAVYTAVPTARWAEAVAIRGERIVAVGAAEAAAKAASPRAVRTVSRSRS